MADRHFLSILVIFTVISGVWLSFVKPISNVETLLIGLLALLGLAAVANVNNVAKSGALMPLFFVAALGYSVYLYFTVEVGLLLISIAVISLLGLILSYGIGAKAVKVSKPVEAARVPSPAKKSPKKKKKAKKK